MKTLEEKKKFALDQIAPYYHDPSLCGYEDGFCKYLTHEGKMCVAGKNLLNPKAAGGTIVDILEGRDQIEVFKPNAANILSNAEWGMLQAIHDKIATKGKINLSLTTMEGYITRLNLFTLEELKSWKPE